jgi:uncharacterized protein (DUF169 family)
MIELSDFRSCGRELKKLLLLRTSPIAVRFLETEEDIPKGTVRPKRDFGFHLSLCQGFAMSRREKTHIAMLKNDHWCYVPVLAFGLAEPPEYFLEGNTFFGTTVADMKTAKEIAETMPRMEYGKYVGVVSAPLGTANFEPDLVVIYCNTNQLRCLLSGMKYKDGYMISPKLDPGSACVHCTVLVMQTGDCQVSVPCGGDRKHALAQDDEMIFSIPRSRLEDLILGLRHFEKIGFGYTRFAPEMRPQYPLFDRYVKVGKMVGMDVEEK